MALLDALKTNIGTKQLTVVLDADGKEVQPEVREDEEQRVKLDEIIDLLYAAGYFRARIKGLSSFDKVIGGMTWCIDSCDVNIDVDLLFKEDLNIGQRLSLSEKIVGVLPKIKCPHRIEPHQIHGLDFIHIYPVIQWLVKHSIERRRETEQYNRSYAVRLYEKKLGSGRNKITEGRDDSVQSIISNKKFKNINVLQDKYRPQRKFRRTGPLPSDPAACVASTLFEYGLIDSVIQVSDDVQGTSELEQNEKKQQQQPPLQQDKIKSSVSHDEIANTMTALSHQTVQDNEIRLPAGVVGNIVSLQADEIAEAVQRYTQLQAESEASTAVQLSQMREKCCQLEDDKQRIENELETKTQYLQQLQQSPLLNDQLNESPIRSLSEAEQGVLKKLQNLVSMNEFLKQQELLFREQCKTELVALQNLVREAEESESIDADGTGIGVDADILDKLNERVAAERLVLGQRTRAVVSLQRQVDQVPTRTELAQYQRRFMELYSQVSGKHRETKQFFASYNILNNKHQYLNKELNILNSIQDNYLEAMSSTAGKEQFMNQLDQIVEGVKQNKKKVEDVRNEERKNRDRLNAQLLLLIDQQRQYVAALKQLMSECHNEAATRPHSNALQL